jgi:hypothetical protein
MVETFTPAVCGSRHRQRLALLGFAVGAVATSVFVGAALGALGMVLGIELALVVAGLALLAAAREAGLVRLPLPQVRRQVPERWRATLPLPVWSIGYGAGLGAGFFTFQPVSTFWVACAGAVALGQPVAAAACFAAYGVGRTVMTMVPRRGQRDATSAVEALVRRRRVLVAANVGALVVCAALLAAPAAGAATSIGPGFDPAATGTALARAQRDGGNTRVIVQPEAGSMVAIPGAAAPGIDGDLLAYADDEGIKVVEWSTSTEVARIDGAVSKPALDWPLVAFIRTGSEKEHLFVKDFTHPGAPTQGKIGELARRNDLGRPSLAGGRIAWHVVTRGYSKVLVESLASGNRQVIRKSKIALESNPALTPWRIVWVEQRARSASLLLRRFGQGSTKKIHKINGRDRRLLTTAITGRTAYVTRWTPATGASTLVRVNF